MIGGAHIRKWTFFRNRCDITTCYARLSSVRDGHLNSNARFHTRTHIYLCTR